MKNNEGPYIKPSTILPEVTVKAVVLGLLLSAILAGANAYLGLFAGMTVSASIPAAVISMFVLSLFKKHNILENNAVQTAASAGESVAAGVIFTLPALVLMGYWQQFNYWETMLIALCGGVLGVLFTIPLRSALIVRQKLLFPEGVATAEVLKTGEEGGKSVRFLVIAGIIGALAKLLSGGIRLWAETFEMAALLKKKAFLYFSLNLSPALVGVGYIVGLRIASLIFIGGVISWWIAIPAMIALDAIPDSIDAETLADPAALGGTLWNLRIRFLGVGAMVVGGLWALISLRSSIGFAFKEGLAAFKDKKDPSTILRTDRDTPMNWVIIMIAAMIIPVFIIYLREIENVPISALMAILMVIGGFLFSAVAGYMAGLVGSSNNPISGVTIATILSTSLILLALLGTGSGNGAAGAILVGAVVCCAAAIAGDNMQDLKAGNLLGATPQKQQIMQMVGVVGAALALPFILDLLNVAYGFGAPTEARPNSLTAPQASLMQSVAEGVFNQNLPWNMIIIGAVLGVIIILIDQYQKSRGSSWRVPVLAVAVGLYLPFELDSSIMLGGVIAWLVQRYQQKRGSEESGVARSEQTGLLIASGLITGEALVGILLALPIVISGNSKILTQYGAELLDMLGLSHSNLPGLLIIGLVCYYLYRNAVRMYDDDSTS